MASLYIWGYIATTTFILLSRGRAARIEIESQYASHALPTPPSSRPTSLASLPLWVWKPPTLVEEPGLAYEPSRRSTTEPGSSDSHKPTLRPLAARRIGRVAYLCNILHTHSRVWITLNKLLYAPLRYRLPG